jgi:hypothetical protein
MHHEPSQREVSIGIAIVADPHPGVPAIDPSATCDSCGALGTVARASRTDVLPATFTRYCERCWPERQEAARETNEPLWWHIESWRNVQSFLAEAAPALAAPVQSAEMERERRDWCRAIAKEIRDAERRYEGLMPADVRSFLEQHDGAT